MVAPNGSDDDVRINLDFGIAEAIRSLSEMLSKIDDVERKTRLVGEAAKQMAASYGKSVSEMTRVLRQHSVEQDMAFGRKANPLTNVDFSSLGKSAVIQDNEMEATRLTESLRKVPPFLKDVDDGVNKTSSSMKGWNQVMATVRGTLTAFAVFGVIQFLQSLVMQLVDAAQKADKLIRALVDLKNVEKLLSDSGIEVSMKVLLDIVSRLEEKFKLLSKINLTELVGNLAIATREFGFSPQQIESMAEVAALLAETQNIDTKSAGEAVVRALSGRSQGNQILKQAGIFLTEEVIKRKAIELSLVKQGEALTQNVTAATVLVLLQEKSAGLLAQIADLEASDAGKVALVKKGWEELLTTIGTGFYGLVATGGEFLLMIERSAERTVNFTKLILLSFQAVIYAWRETIKALASGDFSGNALEKFSQYLDAFIKNKASAMFPTPLKEGDFGFGNLFGGDSKIVDNLNKYITAGDNATATTEALAEALSLTEEQTDKAGKELEDLAEDLQKLGERADELKDKYDTALSRSNEDFLQKQQRELEDYNRSVYELNQETNDKIANAQRKHRQQEEDDERKFQERMLELREKFLFDLEDALHERDARQVLRLIRGYNLEKDQLIRQHNIEKKQREEQFRDEIADIRRQAAERLAQLAYEYNTKKEREIEDQAEANRRRLEDYNKEKAQLQQQITERLQQTASALTKILGLTAEKQALIYNLLAAYYGPGMYFDQLYDYSYASLVQKTQLMLEKLRGLVNANQPPPLPGGGTGGGGGGGGGKPPLNQIPFAKGGAAVANKPTRALFGEAGPELALFLPLDKLSSALGATTSSGNMNSSPLGAGSLKIDISLADGLRADIVDDALGAMADLVTSVNRTRK